MLCNGDTHMAPFLFLLRDASCNDYLSTLGCQLMQFLLMMIIASFALFIFSTFKSSRKLLQNNVIDVPLEIDGAICMMFIFITDFLIQVCFKTFK